MFEISRYITIDERNDGAWGEEIADLLVLIGNAMESFFKDMYDCPNMSNLFSKKKKNITMEDYRNIYESYYELSENSVNFSHGLGKEQSLIPFKDFGTTTPVWWNAYNHTKHEFYSSMEEANIGNLLNALGGLLILNSLHLCSSFYLGWHGEIQNPFVDNTMPDLVVKELIKSKIGTTIWGSSFSVQTPLFIFNYRVDKTINVVDESLLSLVYKNGNRVPSIVKD